jgi:hypothetical protein
MPVIPAIESPDGWPAMAVGAFAPERTSARASANLLRIVDFHLLRLLVVS